jgi:DNA polymerase I-like protein with 3'-5' exonuclease and polymerase domains
LGFSEKRWQEIIDAFYKKYSGGAAWHRQIIQEAQTTGRLTIPSGRYFPFSPIKKPDGNYARDKEGALKWPITQIKNYPVQGFGADLVMLARLEAKKLLDEASLDALLIGTIHDSIVADCSTECVERVGAILLQAVERVPRLVKQIWNYDFSLPLTAECSFGPNKFDLEELKL